MKNKIAQKNLVVEEIIRFVEESSVSDKIEVICYSPLLNRNYILLTKLFDSEGDWVNFKNQVAGLELILREEHSQGIKVEALPFGKGYARNFGTYNCLFMSEIK